MVQLIVPKYAAELANTAIDLATAPVELTAGKESVTGIGTARLDLTAKERVIIEVSVGHEAFGFRREDDLCLKFGPHGRKTPVLSTLSTFSSDGNALLSLIVRRGTLDIVRNRRAHLSHALVHILNFPDFFCLQGRSTDFHHEERLLGRVILHSEDWEIEIQALPFTHKLVKQLKARGGNAITHVARIARVNGKSFTRAKLDALVHDLQRFLSFARGSWTSVFGTVGYDRDGQEV